ncbi:MAG: DUF2589 domain-containing protein [Treponema sp.]|nr:DUF2589 domain-containing protein [Treponema sp.]
MSIGEQFKGLDMKNLIGGPLTAAAEANLLLARTTAGFINEVGFDVDKKARSVQFKFNKQEPTEDGNMIVQEMSVEVPILAIVPIPNLQIDEVNVLFDMEVKQCEKSESSLSGSGSFSAKAKFGPISVNISGSVSSHSSNTRSSDNSAKYHVDVRATNHGTPEGLARVLDMMAAAVSPNITASRPTDQSGAELTGERRERSLKLKTLREKSLQLENAERAARDTKDIKLKYFTQRLQAIQNDSSRKFSDAYSKKDEKEKEKLNENAVDTFWNELQLGADKKVLLAASSGSADTSITNYCPPEKDYSEFTNASGSDGEFKEAVKSQIEWEKKQKAVDDNKTEYNNVMMGVNDESSAPAKIK